MVRSLAQWTKTLSFPARISPHKAKEAASPLATPTPSNQSLSDTMMNNNCASLTEVSPVS